jgi:hypothetical protein
MSMATALGMSATAPERNLVSMKKDPAVLYKSEPNFLKKPNP